MNQDDTEPRYVISVTARMLGIQTYTLRYYEDWHNRASAVAR